RSSPGREVLGQKEHRPPPLLRGRPVRSLRDAQSSTSTRPRSTARARRRGTLTSRPPERTGTRSAGCAFHCERRARVLLRDILRLGTAMGPTSPSVLVTDARAPWAPEQVLTIAGDVPGGSAQAL